MRPDNAEHSLYAPILKVLEQDRQDPAGRASSKLLAKGIVDAIRDHMALYTELERPTPFSREPESDSVTTAFSHLAMEAIKKIGRTTFPDDMMNVSLVVVAPNEKIAVASTEPTPVWMLEAFVTAALSVRRTIRQAQ